MAVLKHHLARRTRSTTGGVETTYDLWRMGRWHLKLVWWKAR